MRPDSSSVPSGALSRRLPLILACLFALGPFAIDTYLPAFAQIGEDLHASPIQVQQTLTAYLVPFGLMTLWHGALSDAMGRRRPILLGLVLFGLASLGAGLTESIQGLWAWRAVQGAVAGVGMTVGRAVVRDVVEGVQAQRMLAQATILFAIAPAVAPVVGGWIVGELGWRAVFWFLALLAFGLTLLIGRCLPETLPTPQRVPMEWSSMLRAYRSLACDAHFLRLSGALALIFLGFFIYVLAAPVYLTSVLGLAADEFYWLFAPAVIGTVCGAYLSSRLAGRIAPGGLILWGGAVMLLALVGNFAQALLMEPARVPWATIPIALHTVGLGLVMAPLQLMVLERFPGRRGMAASGMAFIQSASNAIFAGWLVPMMWHSSLVIAWGVGVTLCVAAGLLIHEWRRFGPSSI